MEPAVRPGATVTIKSNQGCFLNDLRRHQTSEKRTRLSFVWEQTTQRSQTL